MELKCSAKWLVILLHILLAYAKSNTRDTTPVSSFHFCLWLLSRTVQWRSVPSCLEGNIKLFFLVLSYQSLPHVAVVVSSSSHPITRLSSHYKRLYHLVYYHPQIPFRIKGKIQTWSFSRRRAFNFSGKLHAKLKPGCPFFSRQQFLSSLFSFDIVYTFKDVEQNWRRE